MDEGNQGNQDEEMDAGMSEEDLTDSEDSWEDSRDAEKPLFLIDLDVFKCDNGCSKLLKVPTKQCLGGHIFCRDCHEGQIDCMVCGGQNALVPARRTDQLLNAIHQSCPFKLRGCQVMSSFYDLDAHVLGCEYGKLFCPLASCVHAFQSRIILADHVGNNHRELVQNFDFGVPLFLSLPMEKETRVFIENQTRFIIIFESRVQEIKTMVKIYAVCFNEDRAIKYALFDQLGFSLIEEQAILTTNLRGGIDDVIPFCGIISNQLREGDGPKMLNCSLIIS